MEQERTCQCQLICYSIKFRHTMKACRQPLDESPVETLARLDEIQKVLRYLTLLNRRFLAHFLFILLDLLDARRCSK